ncbi:nucleoside-diphosphate-sugar epimerase [Cladophialophora carrionii]|uniref:Nucleoside-diphosphate-sugar epimerase n=1 Tax=Cladophialophora carrionii TaxID=86049 RepID=A0A1C1CD95_9EURO|nr:nucleoside-diphosphate-sugar epimerase [Cladophialophora carrionii]
MVHLILTGATGLIGSSVLSHILSLPPTSKPAIDKLSILTRSTSIPWLAATPPPGTPTTNNHTEIEVIEHRDFATYPPELLARLKGADACIWALGVSQNDVSKDEYVTITRDYAVEAAKAFSTLRAATAAAAAAADAGEASETASETFKFVYVSGEGATLHPRPWTPIYGRVKGETERALLDLSKTAQYSPLLSVYSVRPAAVDGANQPWIWDQVLHTKRTAFQRFYLKGLMHPIRWGWAGGEATHSPTEALGRVLVDMAVSEQRGAFDVGVGVDAESEGRTLGNKRLRMLERGQGWWK